ncbi:MAG TPA: trypsin-like peptidase domain-containing protein [Pirellulaceae bacterium]|nr:trypsin-like peptidase domain-containing protein [Pirellulaceae bacterium]
MGAFSSLLAIVAVSVVGDVELLFFHGEFCPPCREVAPVVERMRQQGYPIRPILVEEDRQAADRFDVRQVPTFILVVDGREIRRSEGAISDREMAGWIEQGAEMARLQPPSADGSNMIRPVGYQAPASDSQAGAYADERFLAAPPADSIDSPRRNDDEYQGWRDQVGFARRLDRPQQNALAATVRIVVSEPNSVAYGSGTIIDQRGTDALVLTCGHLFRDAQSRTSIEVEFGFPGEPTRVPAMVLGFDSEDHDVALVIARVDRQVPVAPLASPNTVLLAGDPVFSVGCDGGADPTVFRTRIKAITDYVVAKKFDTYGRPAQGRSGGGLFTAGGQLVGICNAAAVEVDEGIFAGPDSLIALLDHHGLRELLERPAHLAQADPRTAPGSSLVSDSDAALLGAAPIRPVGHDRFGAPGAVGPGVSVASPASGAGRVLRVVEEIPGQPGATRTLVIHDPDPALVAALEAQARDRNVAVAEGNGASQAEGADQRWNGVPAGYGSGGLMRGQSPR